MCSAVLFILRSRLLAYSTVSGGQDVLSGLSVRLFWFVQPKTVCRFGCMYLLVALVRACVCRCDGDVICAGHDLNRCPG